MEETREESIKKLGELIMDIDVAMMVTIDEGILRSRPMSTQKTEFDGDLWFFTSLKDHKVEEIEKDNRVNLSYSKPDDTTYVSVSGRIEFVRDQAKIDELWNPIYRAWFEEGKDDPDILLLRVIVERAEYWDYSSGKLMQLAGFVKSLITGKEADAEGEDGNNRTIDFAA
jgi:general stress protein 26